MEFLPVLLITALIVGLVVRARVKTVIVYEFESGLRYSRGRLAGTVGPGRYWINRTTSEIRKIDTRPRFISIPGQEVLSSDGVTLKTSLAAQYSVADPETAINKVESYSEALYLTLQLALREIIGQAKIDDVLSRRDEFGRRLLELCAPAAESFGLKLEQVDIKDIMFPGDLKKMFAQVVAAQKEGLASLEKARGETAALRNLANAARLVDDNPALMQLRLLQQLASSSGNTLVLGMPSSTTPLPVRGPEDGSEPRAIPEPPEVEE